MKPSDLSPLFSDEDATPEEIARARRTVAKVELQEAVKEYRTSLRELDYKASSSAYEINVQLRMRIIELVLELFPDSSK